MASNTEIWDQYWHEQHKMPDQNDAMSLFLARAIWSKAHDLKGRGNRPTIIEVGAGSGRASRYLNLMGAQTAILDISSEAIKFCKFANQEMPNPVEFHEMSFFNISTSNLKERFDVSWNAGVLEHFSPDEQTKVITQMASAIKPGGYVVILTPFAGSILYRFGKFILESLGRFPYGGEVPVSSLKQVIPHGLQLHGREKSFGFVILLFNGFKAMANIPGLGFICSRFYFYVNRIFYKLLSTPWSASLIGLADSICSRVLGGYLLITVVEVPSRQK